MGERRALLGPGPPAVHLTRAPAQSSAAADVDHLEPEDRDAVLGEREGAPFCRPSFLSTHHKVLGADAEQQRISTTSRGAADLLSVGLPGRGRVPVPAAHLCASKRKSRTTGRCSSLRHPPVPLSARARTPSQTCSRRASRRSCASMTPPSRCWTSNRLCREFAPSIVVLSASSCYQHRRAPSIAVLSASPCSGHRGAPHEY